MNLYQAKMQLDPDCDWTPITKQHEKIKEVFKDAPPRSDTITIDTVHFEFMAMGLQYAQRHLLKQLPYFAKGIRQYKRDDNDDFLIRKDGAILRIEEIQPQFMTEGQIHQYFSNVCDIVHRMYIDVVTDQQEVFCPTVLLANEKDIDKMVKQEEHSIERGGVTGGSSRIMDDTLVHDLHIHMNEYSKKWKPYVNMP